MCGIVGMIGSNIGTNEKKMFKDLLVIDTIRGGDSTGYIGVDASSVIMPKKAIDGWGFTGMSLFSKSLAGLIKPTALIGHNRWATKGAVTDGNAHPFVADSTYLVHNGSLRGSTWTVGKDALHDHKETPVDSEAICFNIEHEGFKNTVEKLDGAFVLVSYDYNTDIVSFCRNDQRPLWCAEVKDKDVLIFASEAYMIGLAASRNNVTLAHLPWEFKTGVIMTFDLLAKDILKSRTAEDVVLKEEYVYAPYQNTGYHYDSNQYWCPKSKKYIDKAPLLPVEDKNGGNVGKPRAPTGGTTPTIRGTNSTLGNVVDIIRGKRRKNCLADWGLNFRGTCYMIPMKFVPFGTSGRGSVKGELYTLTHKCIKEGVMFSMSEEHFNEIKDKLIQVAPESIHYHDGASKEGQPVVQWGRQVSEKQATSYFEAYYNLNTDEVIRGLPFRGPYGKEVSRVRFKYLTEAGCCMCTDPIPPLVNMSQKVSWVYGENPLCDACTELYGSMAKKSNSTIEEQIEETLA